MNSNKKNLPPTMGDCFLDCPCVTIIIVLWCYTCCDWRCH